jgi:hypothetical protein
MKGPGAVIDGIYLRYSGKGHLRFSIPQEICGDEASAVIEQEIIRKDGVYRVNVFKESKKLSIRFDEAVTGFKDICLSLKEIVEGLPETSLQKPAISDPPAFWSGLKAKIKKGEEILSGKIPITKKAEKEVITILNEIAVFYLIALHRDVITKKLIKSPLKYIGAWLTLFYLVFLYVRHKKG